MFHFLPPDLHLKQVFYFKICGSIVAGSFPDASSKASFPLSLMLIWQNLSRISGFPQSHLAALLPQASWL